MMSLTPKCSCGSTAFEIDTRHPVTDPPVNDLTCLECGKRWVVEPNLKANRIDMRPTS